MNHIPQEQYDYIISNMPIVCVDLCIKYQDKILLVKRTDEPSKNQWWLPGGRLYKGENLKECAYRKAIEETGLKCSVGPIIHTASTMFNSGPNGINVHSVNIVFLLTILNNDTDVKLDSHSSEFQWVNVMPYVHEYVRTCLEKSGLV